MRWVCDLDAATAARGQALAPHAAVTGDVDRVLADPAVHAVVIATPAATHADLACRALAAGKHVLVEKPLALAVTDAERVVAAATAAGRVVLVGHLMVFHPALVRLKELVASGELGDLYYLHSRRVNLGRLRRDENALWSFGPHDVSMIDALLEEAPVRVTASRPELPAAGHRGRGVRDPALRERRHGPHPPVVARPAQGAPPDPGRLAAHGRVRRRRRRQAAHLRQGLRAPAAVRRLRRVPDPARRRHPHPTPGDGGAAAHRGAALRRLHRRRRCPARRRGERPARDPRARRRPALAGWRRSAVALTP